MYGLADAVSGQAGLENGADIRIATGQAIVEGVLGTAAERWLTSDLSAHVTAVGAGDCDARADTGGADIGLSTGVFVVTGGTIDRHQRLTDPGVVVADGVGAGVSVGVAHRERAARTDLILTGLPGRTGVAIVAYAAEAEWVL